MHFKVESACFKKQADFENAVFENVGHFERVRFLAHTPGFRGCKIDSTRLEFSNDSYFPKKEDSEDAIKNISFLKRLADEHGQTDQALNFNAMELRAKRLQTTPKSAPWAFKAVTWLYEKLSDYGRSFMRPLMGYVGLLLLSVVLTMACATYGTSAECANQALCIPPPGQPPLLKLSYERAVFEYAMFRAGGLLDFTDTGKQNHAVNCKLFGTPIDPPVMRGWGVFKAIASLAFLFLMGLGLRNKYRIK